MSGRDWHFGHAGRRRSQFAGRPQHRRRCVGVWRHVGVILPLSQARRVKAIAKIGHADFGTGAGRADSLDDQREAAFLCGEDMLDASDIRARVACRRRCVSASCVLAASCAETAA